MSSHASWTIEEDLLLREGVLRCGMHWDEVAAYLDQKRSAEACERRWAMTMHNIVKGAWTPEEDNLLCRLVGLFGQKSWAEVARGFPGRTGKQCRERWLSHHQESGNNSRMWTDEEDQMLLDAREKVGNRWSLIAKVLPGRSESHVKQRFNTIVTRIWRDATAFEEDERRHEATVAKSNRITPRPSLDDRREVDEQYFVAAANVKGLYDLRHQENDLFKRVEFSQREWEILEAKATRKAQDAPYEAASLAATATAALGHSFDHFQIPPREAICSPPPPLEIQQQQAQSSTSMESVEWNFFCDELCASPTNRLDLLSEDEIMADDAHPTFVSA